jgi:phage shock protein PspC (stress-responsive transcriptional regulator)
VPDPAAGRLRVESGVFPMSLSAAADEAGLMNTTEQHTATNGSSTGSHAGTRPGSLPLRRPTEGRILAGVAAGIARTLGVDPIIVRVGFLVLALVGGAGLPLYLAGWLLIPDEATGQSLAAELIGSLSSGR